MKAGKILAIVMAAGFLMLSACGKSEPINADSGKKQDE